jgi:endonuclease/exonuclease/phosphatase (EEP) superfamily protein YafD
VLSWGYLAGACAVTALLWGFGDSWWPATLLLFIGRWGFLLPLALLVPAAIAVRRKLLVPLLLGAVVVLGPVMGFRTGWRRVLPTPDGVRLRVVTFNADGGERVAPRLPFLVRDWAPDVLAMQECNEELAAAARAVSGYYHHDAEGLCLLSRFPIRSASAMDRTALEALRMRGWANGRQVGGAGFVIRYVIAAPTGDFGFTNLHLETPRKGFDGLLLGDLTLLRANTELRDIESDLARRWVDGSVAPRVVAGDFNTPIESRIFQRHWGGWADAWERVGRGAGHTKFNGWIRVRIDHVLTGPGWRAARVRVGDDAGSSHRPLIVELERE